MDASKDRASENKKSRLLLGTMEWKDSESSFDDGTYHGVREIRLHSEYYIYSIQVVYDKNGKPITAEKHGDDEMDNKDVIELQYPEEILVGVSGHYDEYNKMIRSLTFKSNRKTHGPFGLEKGIPFTFAIDGGLIVGFYGSSGRRGGCLYDIGIAVEACKDHASGNKNIILLRPCGGNGGTSWDDGTYHGVRAIRLSYGVRYGDYINSIQVVYDKNGRPITAEKHGGVGGYYKEIKLQYPEEILVGVSGCYDSDRIRSLTFKSNRRTYGPFGVPSRMPFGMAFGVESVDYYGMVTFSLSMDGGLIVGFHGRSGDYLDAIGFHWHSCRVETTKMFERVQNSLQMLTRTTASKSSAPKDTQTQKTS